MAREGRRELGRVKCGRWVAWKMWGRRGGWLGTGAVVKGAMGVVVRMVGMVRGCMRQMMTAVVWRCWSRLCQSALDGSGVREARAGAGGRGAGGVARRVAMRVAVGEAGRVVLRVARRVVTRVAVRVVLRVVLGVAKGVASVTTTGGNHLREAIKISRNRAVLRMWNCTDLRVPVNGGRSGGLRVVGGRGCQSS